MYLPFVENILNVFIIISFLMKSFHLTNLTRIQRWFRSK